MTLTLINYYCRTLAIKTSYSRYDKKVSLMRLQGLKDRFQEITKDAYQLEFQD